MNGRKRGNGADGEEEMEEGNSFTPKTSKNHFKDGRNEHTLCCSKLQNSL